MNFGAWQLLITIQCQCLKENSVNIRPNISFCVWQKKEIIHVWNNMRMTIPLKVEMENCLSHLSDWEGKQLWIEAALSSWSKISTHPSKSRKNCFKSANADFINPGISVQLTESTLIIATTQPPAFHLLSFARMCLRAVQKLSRVPCHLAVGSSPPGMGSFVLTPLLIAVQWDCFSCD